MLKDTFCSSPWFHLRILPNGDYNTCRWASNKKLTKNISSTSLLDFYNGEEMCNLRTELLNGNTPDICSSCYYEDNHNKLNGRKKQLLKSGITDLDFELKLRNSPHYDYFKHSLENNGESTYYPVDLQIDLGNACNSACIMCNPQYSSRLEKEFKILNKYDNELFQLQDNLQSWTNDDVLVDKFINELTHIKGIKYIHFLGGETLYKIGRAHV